MVFHADRVYFRGEDSFWTRLYTNICKRRSEKLASPIGLGIDTGGTFTDVVAVEQDGLLSILKVPSTPKDPAIAPIDAIRKLGDVAAAPRAPIGYLAYGTTIATNAILQEKFDKVAMVTTAGFRDVLEIGRQARSTPTDDSLQPLYDVRYVKPPGIIRRSKRFVVSERTAADGEILKRLNDSEMRTIASQLRGLGVHAVAVAFINSYANPDNENRAKAILSTELPSVFVCTSTEVLREYREYERFSTTALNAAVTPIMRTHLERLGSYLQSDYGLSLFHVMQCTGGILSADAIRDRGVYTVFSGLVGGVLGAAWMAEKSGIRNIISMDMGGTSSDIALIENGKPNITTDGKIGPYPVKFPMIDVQTIGAGGGSIAWIDSGGLLRVGPNSAGADPGPACYSRGGTEPTVTDASLVLGRLSSRGLLGGTMDLSAANAERAIFDKVAKPLGLSLEESADGIIRVINASMLRGLRRVSVERGRDPRDYSLVAFGGAGPMHASELKRELNVRTVLLPAFPGVLSAMGLLLADVVWDSVETFIQLAETTDLDRLNETLTRLFHLTRDRLAADGIDPGRIVAVHAVDCRYAGQGYEITVPLSHVPVTEKDMTSVIERFHTAHQQLYDHSAKEVPVEIVNVRVQGLASVSPAKALPLSMKLQAVEIVETSDRKVYFGKREGWISCPVVNRYALRPGDRVEGPAIITQFDSTSVLFPGDSGISDDSGNLLVRVDS